MDNNQISNQPNWGYKAGIIRRYLAIFIDSLLFIPVNIVLSIVGTFFSRENFALTILFFLLPGLVFLFYNIFFIWKYGATLGKKWLKVKVISEDGQALKFSQAFNRESWGKFLSGLVFSFGYFWAIWDKNRQTWHDKLAKTYVVTSVPNDGKNPWWLYLVLILPVIALVAILAAVVVLAINPLELQRRGRDSTRIADLSNLEATIKTAQIQNPQLNLCAGVTTPCEGNSNILGKTDIDGSGWVEVDLSEVQTVFTMLPLDPLNGPFNGYRYCSDGNTWELNARLESKMFKSKMQDDGGDSINLYEIGTNLKACLPPENLPKS